MYGETYRSLAKWRTRARNPILLRQESFTGMRDSYDTSAAHPRKAQLLQNVYPQDPQVGGGVVGRPGFRELTASFAANAQGQRSYQFTKQDGTELTVVFSGGEMAYLSSALWALRELSSPVALGGALVLDGTALISCTTFNDGLVISDGVHKPIFATWGGASWTFAEMTNCPVIFGQMVVHYARLVGIKADERNTIVWSEVNQHNTGFEAGGYNNAWALVQTDQEPLFALGATNEALYYWRAYAIGAIYGEITEEWATAGVQDSVSTTVGTSSPWAVVQHENTFWFPDSDARVQRLVIGGGLTEPAPYLDSRETTRNIARPDLVHAVGCDWAAGGLVLLAFTRISGDPPEIILAFEANTANFAGVWRSTGGHFRTLDIVKDGDGRPVIMHLNDTGDAFDWGHPQGTVWSDVGEAIEHIVHGTALGNDHAAIKKFVRLDVIMRLTTDLTDMKVSYITPRGASSEMSVSGAGSFTLWDDEETLWDDAMWSGDTLDSHLPVGLFGEGRWIQVMLRHAGLNEEFGLQGWTVEAYPMGAHPLTP